MAALAALPAFAAPCLARVDDDIRFKEIRARLGEGGRVGVHALDSGSGRQVSFDADSRYAMCSTFKMALAAAVLARIDKGLLSASDEIAFTAADLLDHAPVVRPAIERGRLPVESLCRAVVEVSDNSAANLLLARIGGAGGLTSFIRAAGDGVTRLDRNEPELNSNIPGDPRDTTSPRAMVGLMKSVLTGPLLSAGSRRRLIGWMEASPTGRNRLRTGLPLGWRAGDKTGTGANGSHNDLAIAWPPGRPPLLIASFLSGGDAYGDVRSAAHASIAELVVRAMS